MTLLLKFTIFSIISIAASVTNNEGKEGEVDFAGKGSDVKDVRELSEDGHGINVDDHVKRYANESVTKIGHEGNVRYRSKMVRKLDVGEDNNNQMRRRPDYGDKYGSIPDNKERIRPDYNDEDGSCPDDNEKKKPNFEDENKRGRRPNYDKVRRPKQNRRRKADSDDENGSMTDDDAGRRRPDYDEDGSCLDDSERKKPNFEDENERRRRPNYDKVRRPKQNRRRKDDSDYENGSITDCDESMEGPANGKDRKRPNDNIRRKPDKEDEGGNIPHNIESKRGLGNDVKKKVNDKKRRRKGGKIGASCQTCGKMNGGKPVKLNYHYYTINGRVIIPAYKYPWVVALRFSGPIIQVHRILCGGAIISATYILTASSCVSNHLTKKLPQCRKVGLPLPESCFYNSKQISVGLLPRRWQDKPRPIQIAQIILHDKYVLHGVHDIALIKLAVPIQCNHLSSPICLPTTDLQKIGGKLIVAGWGSNAPYEQRGRITLREGMMTQVKPEDCVKNDPTINIADIVCAIGTETKQSSCGEMGDGGTSIFAKFGSKFYTLGITSSMGCNYNDTVKHAKVYSYIDWIKSHVKDLPESK